MPFRPDAGFGGGPVVDEEPPSYADDARTGTREAPDYTNDPAPTRDEYREPRDTWTPDDGDILATVGALAGVYGVDELEVAYQGQPTLNPWGEDFEGFKPGDRALASAVIGGVDVPGDEVADDRARAMGADPASPDTNLLQLARSQLGVDYVWAASSPGSAFDCSGFTQWVLKRYGIDTPHMAELQQQQFASVGREELQPGDLVFFNYGRKAAGVADHVGLYIGNGQMIDASSSQDQIVERAVDWDNFIGGGATGIQGNATIGNVPSYNAPAAVSGGGAAAGAAISATPGGERSAPPAEPQGGLRGASLLANEGRYQGDALAEAVYALAQQQAGQDPVLPAGQQSFTGNHGDIKSQLYAGFMAAGRPDLAAMVGTKEFEVWIGQESGWNPGVTSPANNHGLANDGLFQVWRGHDFNSNGQVSTMSPYEQAMLIAKYFSHLDPDDIRRYAAEIQNGTYGGWG